MSEGIGRTQPIAIGPVLAESLGLLFKHAVVVLVATAAALLWAGVVPYALFWRCYISGECGWLIGIHDSSLNLRVAEDWVVEGFSFAAFAAVLLFVNKDVTRRGGALESSTLLKQLVWIWLLGVTSQWPTNVVLDAVLRRMPKSDDSGFGLTDWFYLLFNATAIAVTAYVCVCLAIGVPALKVRTAASSRRALELRRDARKLFVLFFGIDLIAGISGGLVGHVLHHRLDYRLVFDWLLALKLEDVEARLLTRMIPGWVAFTLRNAFLILGSGICLIVVGHRLATTPTATAASAFD